MPKRSTPMHYMILGKAVNGEIRVVTLDCNRPGQLTMEINVHDKQAITLTLKTSDLLDAIRRADPTGGKQPD